MNDGLPPARPRQRVRTISVTVEHLASGGYRIASPHARGWAEVAKTPAQLARALTSAFNEVTVASYARSRGVPYDLDRMTTQVPGDPLAGGQQRRTRSRSAGRPRAYDPREWTRLDDGRWQAPGGRRYRADSRIVRGVIAKLEQSGGMTF